MAEPKKYQLKNGDTKWMFRAYTGINPKTDKKSYTTRRGFNTEREAKIALRRIENAVINGSYFDDKNITVPTFEELSREWLKLYEPTVSPSSFLSVSGTFENRLIPELGKYKIDMITQQDIQKLADKWGHYKKCSRWISTAGRVFRLAIKRNIIQKNPCTDIAFQKFKKEKKKDFYEVDEVKKFLKGVDEYNHPQANAFFRIALFCGLRKGEILALNFSDFINGYVIVDKTISRKSTGQGSKVYIKKTPKNEASVREVSVDKETFEAVNNLKEYTNTNRVFSNYKGGILTPSAPRKWLTTICKQINLPTIPVHGLRHTHASLLFESGATIKEVQDRLGHSKASTTMDIYTHVTSSSRERLADKFNAFISGDSQKDSHTK